MHQNDDALPDLAATPHRAFQRLLCGRYGARTAPSSVSRRRMQLQFLDLREVLDLRGV